MNLIKGFLMDIGGSTGQLGVVMPDEYIDNMERNRFRAAEEPELKPWIDVLEDESTAERYAAYAYAYVRDAQPPPAPPANIETAIIEDGNVAVITIRNLDDRDRDSTVSHIQTLFYDEISGCEHLIINLAENNGGNSTYWMDAIVAPNITEEIILENHYLMRESELTERFCGYLYKGSQLTADRLLANPAYTRLNREDIADMQHVRSETVSISPLGDSKAFGGRIWVLTSPFVHSGAERFANFCKRTGFATLVGQTTKGDGLMSKPILFALPNSRILVSFCVEYALNGDGTCNQETGTVPDIESNYILASCLEVIRGETG